MKRLAYRRSFPFALLLSASLGAASSAAHAQGFYWNTVSARATAVGGVYVPSATAPLDAMSTNPAGLAELKRHVVEAGATGVFARGSFINSVNNNVPMRTAPGAVPFGAFGMPLHGGRFVMGFSALPELTSVSNWTYLDAPGALGASYGLQQNKSAVTVFRSAAGVGMTLHSRLSIGATFGVSYNSNLLHSPYIFQSQPVVKGLKTLLDLKTSGTGVNGSAGFLLKASRRVQVGVGYRSPTYVRSTGVATGNLGVQLAAAGLGGARPDFRYDAVVHNVFPQGITAHGNVALTPKLSLALQGEWLNWKRAFKTLNVDLSNGNNADINGLLKSSSLHDEVPLDWKNQFPVRAGLERSLGESMVARVGYVHANNAVPGSTTTPLTAAIFTDQVAAGGGWHKGGFAVDGAYAFVPTAASHTGISKLKAGEYSNSSVHVGTQVLTVTTVWVF